MAQATLPRSPVKGWEAVRDAWIEDVESIARQIEQWSEEADWSVKRETKTFVEDEIGPYDLPVLTIRTAKGRVYFNPVGRFMTGATGWLELEVTPAFSRVIVLRVRDKWRFFDEEMKDLKKTWSRESFLGVVTKLLDKP